MLRQGGAGTHVLALVDGLAKVLCHERDGSVTWLAFRGPGDLLGEVSVFNGTARTADVVALSPCTATVIEAERFRRFVDRRGLAMALMQQAQARQRESDLYRSELLTLPLVVRLARSLLRLSELAAPDGSSPTLSLTGLTQEEIAQVIGVTRNSAGSGLRLLREAGALETARRVVVIKNLGTLRRWAAMS